MDCRTSFVLVIGLALGSCGCQHTSKVRSASPGEPAPETTTARPREGNRKQPLPSTFVAMAKVKEELASTSKDTEQQVKLHDQARQFYQQALKNDPKHLAAYMGLAQIYIKLGDHDRAIEIYKKAIHQFPKDAMLWHDLAMCHNSRKDWTKAQQCLDKALAMDPENRRIAQTMGLTLARAGRIDDSVAILSKAFGSAHAHYTVARMLNHMQDQERCREHLRQALQANPNLQAAQDMLAAMTPTRTSTPEAPDMPQQQVSLDLQ